MDDRIDELQDQIFVNPKEAQLAELFALKRELVDMRKLVTPQRDMVSSMLTGVIPIPGMTPESERYVRDLYDHLIRISDMVDSYRDLLSGSLDAYMSMVSNRLNDVMKQLTIIATVFLPLSFLTGFFGQNFAWLVDSARFPGRLPRPRHRHRTPRGRRPRHAVPPPGLDGQGQKILKTFMAERAEVRALPPADPPEAGAKPHR